MSVILNFCSVVVCSCVILFCFAHAQQRSDYRFYISSKNKKQIKGWQSIQTHQRIYDVLHLKNKIPHDCTRFLPISHVIRFRSDDFLAKKLHVELVRSLKPKKIFYVRDQSAIFSSHYMTKKKISFFKSIRFMQERGNICDNKDNKGAAG